MIRLTALALPVALVLSACGVDGAPVPPSEAEAATQPGVTLSGSAEVGIRRTF